MSSQPAAHEGACFHATSAFQMSGKKPCHLGHEMGQSLDVTLAEIDAAREGMCLEHQVCFMRHLTHSMRVAKLEADIRDLGAQIEKLKLA